MRMPASPLAFLSDDAVRGNLTCHSRISAQNGHGSSSADPRATLSEYVRTREYKAEVLSALAIMIGNIGQQVKQYGSLSRVPMEAVANVRNDMYLTSETIRFLEKNDAVKLDDDTKAT